MEASTIPPKPRVMYLCVALIRAINRRPELPSDKTSGAKLPFPVGTIASDS